MTLVEIPRNEAERMGAGELLATATTYREGLYWFGSGVVSVMVHPFFVAGLGDKAVVGYLTPNLAEEEDMQEWRIAEEADMVC